MGIKLDLILLTGAEQNSSQVEIIIRGGITRVIYSVAACHTYISTYIHFLPYSVERFLLFSLSATTVSGDGRLIHPICSHYATSNIPIHSAHFIRFSSNLLTWPHRYLFIEHFIPRINSWKLFSSKVIIFILMKCWSKMILW